MKLIPLILIVISCSSRQKLCIAAGDVSSVASTLASANVTPAPTNPPCPDNFCPHKGSICRYMKCPVQKEHCCICPSGRTGKKCEIQSQVSYQQTVKLNNDFHAILTNTTSSEFANIENDICSVVIQLWQTGYKNRSRGMIVSCKCLKLKPGSIIATLHMELANEDNSPTNISVLSNDEMKYAMTQVCQGTTCESIKFDTNYIVISGSSDVCDSNRTSLCSPFAKCTFHGGVNFTCSCASEYRDDSSGTGLTCTRLCSKTICGKGKCEEQTGGDVQCTDCPTGASGKYCNGSHKVQQSLVLLLITFLCLSISRTHSSNAGMNLSIT